MFNDLQALNIVNERILTTINEMKEMLIKVYPKGILNQKDIKIQSGHLAKIAKDLEKDREKLERLLVDEETLTGENYNQELERTSYSYLPLMFDSDHYGREIFCIARSALISLELELVSIAKDRENFIDRDGRSPDKCISGPELRAVT